MVLNRFININHQGFFIREVTIPNKTSINNNREINRLGCKLNKLILNTLTSKTAKPLSIWNGLDHQTHFPFFLSLNICLALM